MHKVVSGSSHQGKSGFGCRTISGDSQGGMATFLISAEKGIHAFASPPFVVIVVVVNLQATVFEFDAFVTFADGMSFRFYSFDTYINDFVLVQYGKVQRRSTS